MRELPYRSPGGERLKRGVPAAAAYVAETGVSPGRAVSTGVDMSMPENVTWAHQMGPRPHVEDGIQPGGSEVPESAHSPGELSAL
jgi:hypothetical protein